MPIEMRLCMIADLPLDNRKSSLSEEKLESWIQPFPVYHSEMVYQSAAFLLLFHGLSC